MNHVYTTPAFIIKSIPAGEANKIYFLLTQELGFIRASAQSVRSHKSKLKGHLENFSFIKISVVKGKDIWRITNTETILQKAFTKDFDKLSAVKNIFSLLLRLLHGEEKNDALFDAIESFYIFLFNTELSHDDLKSLEAIIVLRILLALGYFKKSSDLSTFAEGKDMSLELLHSFKIKRKLAIEEINSALQETHL